MTGLRFKLLEFKIMSQTVIIYLALTDGSSDTVVVTMEEGGVHTVIVHNSSSFSPVIKLE